MLESAQVSSESPPVDEAAGGRNRLLAAGGVLAALAPYQPLFVAAALGFLAVGFWRVYRRPKEACAKGNYCARPTSDLIAKVGLWTATVLVVAAATFPYTAHFFIDT